MRGTLKMVKLMVKELIPMKTALNILANGSTTSNKATGEKIGQMGNKPLKENTLKAKNVTVLYPGKMDPSTLETSKTK